jgi:formate dehydrogenase iron-sulfur subunit
MMQENSPHSSQSKSKVEKPSINVLINQSIAEQSELNAVERFSAAHDSIEPRQSQYYKELIPLTKPGEGEQYAFEVNLDKCSGCKACVAGCHSLNGLDEEETWRDVGTIFGGSTEAPFQQTVTSACHHCLEPACMNGCPTMAYEKDEVTGIVKHLDDQCIGCQYCTLNCPFDVPKFNSKLGIVRKCDMCSDRLAEGQAPACVQACPTQAIAIKIVSQEGVREVNKEEGFLPGAPDPSFTQPTTRYVSEKEIPENVYAADKFTIAVEHPHWPLVIMLVLTQLSIGAFTVGAILSFSPIAESMSDLLDYLNMSAMLVGVLALGVSLLHLGRPLHAWKAFLGLRTSWMSREIVALGGFAKLAVLYGLHPLVDHIKYYVDKIPFSALLIPSIVWEFPHTPHMKYVGILVAVSGLGAVFCSMMIYAKTPRQFWSFPIGSAKFFGTAAVLGIASVYAFGIWVSYFVSDVSTSTYLKEWGNALALGLVVATFAKLSFEALLFVNLLRDEPTQLKRAALLMKRELLKVTLLRFGTGIVGGLLPLWPFLTALITGIPNHASLEVHLGLSVAALTLLIIGELSERYLFFSAASAPKMPGVFK